MTNLNQQIALTMDERRRQLAALSGKISRKLFFTLEEKLASEQGQLEQFLQRDQRRSQTRSTYSNVLNPHYFEQQLL